MLYHAELLDLENSRNVRVCPDILNADQIVKLQEYAIKHNFVTIIEIVEERKDD